MGAAPAGDAQPGGGGVPAFRRRRARGRASAHHLPGSTVITVLGGRPPAYPTEPTRGTCAGDSWPATTWWPCDATKTWPPWKCSAPAGVAGVRRPPVPPPRRARPTRRGRARARRGRSKSSDPTAVFLPMGMANPDHGVTHDAGLLARQSLLESEAEPAWFCYEDAGYKHIPGITGLEGGQARSQRLVAHARRRPRAPRHGDQASRHRALQEPGGAAATRPRARRAPRRQRPRAALAARSSTRGLGGPDRLAVVPCHRSRVGARATEIAFSEPERGTVKGLLYGVRPDTWAAPDETNPLLVGLGADPDAARRHGRAPPEPRREWVMAKTRLTGHLRFGVPSRSSWTSARTTPTARSGNLFTFPTMLGHEVVAEVAELGAGARGLEVGQRVVLNPWLSCGPAGHRPAMRVVPSRGLQPVLALHRRAAGRRHPHRDLKDAPGGFADYFPAHDSMLIPVPDDVPDEVAVFADPFAVSLHSVTRHPPPPGGKVLVYGAGALGTTATAMLRGAASRRRGHGGGPLRGPGRDGPQRSGATVVAPEPRAGAHRDRWRRGPAACCTRPATACPWRIPGGIDVVYDTIGKPETFEVGVRLLKRRGARW